ncbi:hypothetical protein [Streptomyces sp. ME109]|uniref:hypothetical protein n=1 Tax=Streptomyces sp. me109 TaxID=1827853 RepID=UPI0011CDAF80|nr:hypothetical protein [Streptomyces sp. me109]
MDEVHLHGRSRLRVAGGVVQEFGHGQDDRLDDGAADVLSGLPSDPHPAVILDARLGPAHDVQQRGFVSLPPRPRASQEPDDLGLAGELAAGVVDLVGVGQDLLVVVMVDHRADRALLLVNQRLECSCHGLHGSLGRLLRASGRLLRKGAEVLKDLFLGLGEHGASQLRVERLPSVATGAAP